VADSIRIKDTITLKAQANLGEDIDETEFEAGTELVVLQEFGQAWLVKDDDGRLFNIKKELAEEV
jgi:hypothetical protein